MTTIILSQHALDALDERALDVAWVHRVAINPEWETADPVAGRVRRFGAVPEKEGRFLRVVCERNGDTVTIVTAFLDRKARRP